MIHMAYDHVKHYFSSGVDTQGTSLGAQVFLLIKFVGAFALPVFIFLSGLSVFFLGLKRTKAQVSSILLTRGLWLILLEIFVNNLNWSFDLHYQTGLLQILFTTGACMVLLSGVIFFSTRILVGLSLFIIACHNLLDPITFAGTEINALIWYMLHQSQQVMLDNGQTLVIAFPVLPWFGVMTLGYCVGHLYHKDFSPVQRKRILTRMGISSIVLFLLVRGTNIYGDPTPWVTSDNLLSTLVSFFSMSTFLPSLAFILYSMGPILLLLVWLENNETRFDKFAIAFGSVPLFYYFLHILLIHSLAVLSVYVLGGNDPATTYILHPWDNANFKKYGYSLPVLVSIWLAVVTMLYLPCTKYMAYKRKNNSKWWIKYI